MSAILITFGLDWHLLLVDAINFGLLLAGLTYFLYKPLGRMLEERRQKIAQGVYDAQRAQEELQNIEGTRAGVIAAAGKEADTIISQARAAGSQKERELVGKGETVAASMLKDAEAQAQELKVRAIEESKKEVAKLIVLGMEKAMLSK